MDKQIDWEQRRYELAKAAMQGFCSTEYSSRSTSTQHATWVINLADEVIKRLKETENEK